MDSGQFRLVATLTARPSAQDMNYDKCHSRKRSITPPLKHYKKYKEDRGKPLFRDHC